MKLYRVTFNTNICIEVELDAFDEDQASDHAWNIAEEHLKTLAAQADRRIVSIEASLDGIADDSIEELR